jgi:MGT family glycosyltransferase
VAVNVETVLDAGPAPIRGSCKHRQVREDPVRTNSLGGRRFLLAIIDGGGTVPPALGVATDLVRRGHQVRVLADPTIEVAALAAGCAFSPWQRAPHFDSRGEQTAVIAAVEGRNPYRVLKALRSFAGPGMTRRYADEVIATAQAFPVDAILAEAAVPGIVIGALRTGLPTAALMPNIYLRPTVGSPLFGTGWSPGRGVMGRARDRLAPKAAQWLLARTLPRLNAVLTGGDQPPIRELFELLDRCNRVLVMTSPSFDFTHARLPGNVRYVGPQLDDPVWAAEQTWRRPNSEPLILVATSSIFQHQSGLLQRIAQGLGTLPVQGLITTGQAVDPHQIQPPPNVEVVQAAPHRQVLAEASVVITHAGHGTVLKALAAGVPLICAPMGRDQKDNTVRVLRIGAGLRISKKATSHQIVAAVSDILEHPDYASAARRFAATLAAEAANVPSAADEAEDLLGARPT